MKRVSVWKLINNDNYYFINNKLDIKKMFKNKKFDISGNFTGIFFCLGLVGVAFFNIGYEFINHCSWDSAFYVSPQNVHSVFGYSVHNGPTFSGLFIGYFFLYTIGHYAVTKRKQYQIKTIKNFSFLEMMKAEYLIIIKNGALSFCIYSLIVLIFRDIPYQYLYSPLGDIANSSKRDFLTLLRHIFDFYFQPEVRTSHFKFSEPLVPVFGYTCWNLLTGLFSTAVVDINAFVNYPYFLSTSLLSLRIHDFIWLFDGYTYILIFLTLIIMGLCFYLIPVTRNDALVYYVIFIIVLISLLIAFTTYNILFFYIFFELTVLPMFFLINYGGANGKKIKASYYFMGYTMFGSLSLLSGIIYLYQCIPGLSDGPLPLLLIQEAGLSDSICLFVCTCFFLGFAVKIPLFPVYNWLPEAHVEAPTTGSVILAALLLKLGVYGIYRYCIGWFPFSFELMAPLVQFFCVVGYTTANLNAIIETDIKRIVAFSSIAHMNLTILAFCVFDSTAYSGALYYSFAHGLVSAALFILIGVLYDRYGVRDVDDYGGLASRMPTFTVYFFLFNLANLAFPLTAPFVSEILILIGIWETHPMMFIWIAVGFILSLGYSFLLFTRVCLGTYRSNVIREAYDIEGPEFVVLFILLFIVFFSGIWPEPFLFLTSTSLQSFILK
jgi:NADH-quinone oxidoreductase subunit M